MTSVAIELGPRLRATEPDFAEVYALLQASSAWLRSKGLTQWNPAYPRERFTREIAAGHVWCWKADLDFVATVTLFPDRPEYYPEHVWRDKTPAWYVCRLAIARKYAGSNVGRRVLERIEMDAAGDEVPALRLDVDESNPFLERYYRDVGYQSVAVGEIKGGRSIFMEKVVGVQRTREITGR